MSISIFYHGKASNRDTNSYIEQTEQMGIPTSRAKRFSSLFVNPNQTSINNRNVTNQPTNFFLNLSQLFLLFTLHKLIYCFLVLYTLFFCGEYGTEFGGRETKIGTPSLSILPGSYLTFFLFVCLFVYKDWIWGRGEDGVGSLCDILRTFFSPRHCFPAKVGKGSLTRLLWLDLFGWGGGFD